MEKFEKLLDEVRQGKSIIELGSYEDIERLSEILGINPDEEGFYIKYNPDAEIFYLTDEGMFSGYELINSSYLLECLDK